MSIFVRFLKSDINGISLSKQYTLKEANKLISDHELYFRKKWRRRKNEVVFELYTHEKTLYKGIISLGSSYADDLVGHIERKLNAVEAINEAERENFINLLHKNLQEHTNQLKQELITDKRWLEFQTELLKYVGQEANLFSEKQQLELYQMFLNIENEKNEVIQPFQMATYIFEALKENAVSSFVIGDLDFDHFKTFVETQVKSIPYHEYWQLYTQHSLYQRFVSYVKETKNGAVAKLLIGGLKTNLYDEPLLKGKIITEDTAEILIEEVMVSLIEKEILRDKTGKAEQRFATVLPERLQREDMLTYKELLKWYKEAGVDSHIITWIHGEKEAYKKETILQFISDIVKNSFENVGSISDIESFYHLYFKKIMLLLKETFNPKEIKERLFQSYVLEENEQGLSFKTWCCACYINRQISLLYSHLVEEDLL